MIDIGDFIAKWTTSGSFVGPRHVVDDGLLQANKMHNMSNLCTLSIYNSQDSWSKKRGRPRPASRWASLPVSEALHKSILTPKHRLKRSSHNLRITKAYLLTQNSPLIGRSDKRRWSRNSPVSLSLTQMGTQTSFTTQKYTTHNYQQPKATLAPGIGSRMAYLKVLFIRCTLMFVLRTAKMFSLCKYVQKIAKPGRLPIDES